jgi:ankyrin repeat protein
VAAQLLACAGCDANCRDAEGLAPLHWAAARGAAALCSRLVQVRPPPTLRPRLRPAAHAAARRPRPPHTPLAACSPAPPRHIPAQAGADVNAASTDGWLPLHKAAAGGHLEAAALLISAGSIINFKNVAGCTPLHLAAQGGHAATCERLLAAGCPPGGKNRCGAPGAGPALLERGSAAASAPAACCTWALLTRCPPATPRSSGATPLYCAASAGCEAAVRLLLGAGAEVDEPSGSGCTPLHAAATGGHTAVVQVRWQPLRRAVCACTAHCRPSRAQHSPALARRPQVLLEVGADPDMQTQNGNTPLHNAVSGGHLAAAERLIAAGADLDAQNASAPPSPTPLLLRCRCRCRCLTWLCIHPTPHPHPTPQAATPRCTAPPPRRTPSCWRRCWRRVPTCTYAMPRAGQRCRPPRRPARWTRCSGDRTRRLGCAALMGACG